MNQLVLEEEAKKILKDILKSMSDMVYDRVEFKPEWDQADERDIIDEVERQYTVLINLL